MNNKPEGSSLYLLNAGTIIQVNGVNYALTQDILVSGFEKPRPQPARQKAQEIGLDKI
jgi:hypothetical protein